MACDGEHIPVLGGDNPTDPTHSQFSPCHHHPGWCLNISNEVRTSFSLMMLLHG